MTRCINAFLDMDHPHFFCAHLEKIDIAAEAQMNIK